MASEWVGDQCSMLWLKSAVNVVCAAINSIIAVQVLLKSMHNVMTACVREDVNKKYFIRCLVAISFILSCGYYFMIVIMIAFDYIIVMLKLLY